MNRMVWVDLETTGLRPSSDAILELGIIITDSTLIEVASYSWLVDPFGGAIDSVAKMAPEVYEMHKKSGLLEEMDAAAEDKTLEKPWTVAFAAAEFINSYTDEKTPMAGSSVHFDRRFIESQMPPLLGCFTHQNLDVSSITNAAKLLGRKPWTPSGDRPHRALDDLKNSIDILKAYNKYYFSKGPTS